MSGIAAIVHFDGQPAERKQINRLVQALAWRGQDQQGTWVNGSAAMGAVQFWTTNEAWGTEQPVGTPQGDAFALDGRIDNRADLGRALHIPDRELATQSDAALLWLAYQKWGRACVDHLIGAYAFVIWDARKRELFCGRDSSGLRSFFYHWDGRRFYAASTIHALRSLYRLQSARLNDDYIWDYLTTSFFGPYDVEATPFQGIHRLPGGHFLRLTASGPQITRYWKPWELSPVRYKNGAEYAAHLKSLFDEVVAAYCRAAGPVGVALSGGLDSSSIVSVARHLESAGKLPAEELHTFTLVWEEVTKSRTGYTDGNYADIVAKQYGGKTHRLICDGMTMFDQIPHRGPVPQDEPNFHIYSPWYQLAQKVNQAGIRVLLTGAGADEGLSGNLFFLVDWLRRGQVRDAFRMVKYIAEFTPHSFNQIFFNLVLAGLGPRSVAQYLYKKQPRHSILRLNTRFHARITPWLPDKDRLMRRSMTRHRLIPKNFEDIAIQAQFEAGVLLAGDNTRLWGDQYLGLPAQVDQRYPFYDRRLVEFFFRIPAALKLGQSGEHKLVMRQAMAGTLPDEIRLRTGNTDYGFVFLEGLNRHWDAFRDMFTDSRAAAAGYIDGPAFLEVLNARRLGSELSTDADIIPTLGLEFWLRELERPFPTQTRQVAKEKVMS